MNEYKRNILFCIDFVRQFQMNRKNHCRIYVGDNYPWYGKKTNNLQTLSGQEITKNYEPEPD